MLKVLKHQEAVIINAEQNFSEHSFEPRTSDLPTG